MLGRSHILSGLIAGTAVAGVLDAPLPVRLLVIPVAGGAALLPDLDHRGSKIARSLGPVTRLLAAGVNSVSLAVYDGTATADDPDRNDGHRTFTHTVPGCCVWGVVLLLVGAVGLPVAVCLAVLVGLMGSGMAVRGFGFSVVGGVGSWWVTAQYPGWWWVWPLVVVLGSLAHVAGDAWTTAGVPLAWPVRVRGQRWYRVKGPATMRTGGAVEVSVVTPLLYLGLLVAAGAVTGVLPVVARAVWTVAGG